MRLFIAEKPSLARQIAKGLGVIKNEKGYIQCKNDSIVVSAMGHLLELQEPDHYLSTDVPTSKKGSKVWRMQDLPITPERWVKRCIKGKREQLHIIGKLLEKADIAVVAGDADREGQNLIEELLTYHGWFKRNKPTLRFWAQSTDDIAVKRALAKLENNAKYHPLALAAEGRARADWLVGMNLTRAVTLANQGLGVLPIGRVKTPVLKMISDRDFAIANYQSRDYYNLELNFKSAQGSYIGKWKIPEAFLDQDNYLTDPWKAQEILNRCQNKFGIVMTNERKQKKQTPPIPYDLNKLQVACGKKFGFSPKKTLEIAQELYEKHSLTSYPRSSCGYLSSTQQQDVEPILKNLLECFPEYANAIKGTDPKRPSPIWNDAKVGEEAHTGIIPTLRAISAQERQALSPDCQKVYELVCKRYIACFLPDFTFFENTITTSCESEIFTTIGREIINMGFKAFDGGEEKKKDEESQTLPAVIQGEKVQCEKGEVKHSITKPPVPFTMTSIVEAMENCSKYVDDPDEKKLLKEGKGIGTVATRAAILDTMVKQKLMVAQGKKQELHCTATGNFLLRVVPQKLQSVSLTANAEEEMQKIQRGEGNFAEFLHKQQDFIIQMIKEIKTMAEENPNNNVITCPVCGQKLYRNESQRTKGEFYFKCSNAECKKLFKDNNGQPGEEIARKVAAVCPKCQKQDVIRYEDKKTPGLFHWWCRSCNAHFADNNGNMGAEEHHESKPKQTCPECKEQAVVRCENKKTTGTFYHWCTKCGARFNDDNGKIGAKWGEHKDGEKCPACGQMSCYSYKNKSNDGHHWYCSKCKQSFFDKDGKPGNKIG